MKVKTCNFICGVIPFVFLLIIVLPFEYYFEDFLPDSFFIDILKLLGFVLCIFIYMKLIKVINPIKLQLYLKSNFKFSVSYKTAKKNFPIFNNSFDEEKDYFGLKIISNMHDNKREDAVTDFFRSMYLTPLDYYSLLESYCNNHSYEDLLTNDISIITINSYEDIKKLENINPNVLTVYVEDSIPYLIKYLKVKYEYSGEVTILSGKDINTTYNLEGKMAYPEGIKFLTYVLDSSNNEEVMDFKKLSLKEFKEAVANIVTQGKQYDSFCNVIKGRI